MSAQINFFRCGNGDTILIGGGEDQWALVDANLNLGSGVERRLVEILTKHQVRRLRFVCVTHFDADHIRGLGKFLRQHFGPKPGVREHWEIDQVILPIRPGGLLQFLSTTEAVYERYLTGADEATIALKELFEALRDMWADAQTRDALRKGKGVQFRAYIPGTHLTARDRDPASARLGSWSVRFLGPSTETDDRYHIRFLDQWGLNGWRVADRPDKLRLNVERNSTSRIVALCHRDTGETVLLTGDAPRRCVKQALREWANVKDDVKLDAPHFRVVKASHHGAQTSHHLEVYSRECRPGHSHVVISCGDEHPKHPHPDVIGDLITVGLQTRSTGRPDKTSMRVARRRSGLPLGARRVSGAASDVAARFGAGVFSFEGGYVLVK